MWHADPVLGNDREIRNDTTAAAKYRLARGMLAWQHEKTATVRVCMCVIVNRRVQSRAVPKCPINPITNPNPFTLSGTKAVLMS
jgi:hypothetical protein